MQCFNFSCPDFIWCYRLSKQAQRKVVRIKHLSQDGSKIGTVSHPREAPLKRQLPSSRDYEDFPSRERVFQGIVEALKDPEANMIAVYGTGGVGKTTMVEKVGKLLKEDGTFDEVVTAVVSHDANVIRIQGQLADRLSITLGGETEVGRADQIWNRLDNGKKNLIILDDVWHELDLMEIGGKVEDLTLELKPHIVSSSKRQEKKMSSALIVVDKIVEYIVGKVFQPVERQVGFLFHYKQNVKNLEDEKNNLQQQRSNVQGKVSQAENRGEAIDNNVSDWLKDVDETRRGVDTFMNEKTAKENMRCFDFSCPDFIWRYRLSKQAEVKVVRIKTLFENGSKFGTVSHPREDPPERQLLSSRDYEDFGSRETVFRGIMEALKDPKVNMIGVYGTGGVGKTTMVEKVGKLLKEDGTFDEVVTAVVSHDANVIRIQGELADRLNLTFGAETEVGRGNQLWKRLDNGKKNLIILDDVWHELDLMEIGIFSNSNNLLNTNLKKICLSSPIKFERYDFCKGFLDHSNIETANILNF